MDQRGGEGSEADWLHSSAADCWETQIMDWTRCFGKCSALRFDFQFDKFVHKMKVHFPCDFFCAKQLVSNFHSNRIITRYLKKEKNLADCLCESLAYSLCDSSALNMETIEVTRALMRTCSSGSWKRVHSTKHCRVPVYNFNKLVQVICAQKTWKTRMARLLKADRASASGCVICSFQTAAVSQGFLFLDLLIWIAETTKGAAEGRWHSPTFCNRLIISLTYQLHLTQTVLSRPI